MNIIRSMANTRLIKATEVTRGMMLKRGVYNDYTTVVGVHVGVSHVRIELADGTHQYHRHSGSATKPAVEVAS